MKDIHISLLLTLFVSSFLVMHSSAVAANKVVVVPLQSKVKVQLQNIITVSATGADFTDPIVAMASIADASESNPYLLRIGPGVYDLGNNGLVMQAFVDIEGSGEKVTTITSTHSGNDSETSFTVKGANDCELRFLTVKNLGGGNGSIAIYNKSTSPKIYKVTAFASGAASNNVAVHNNDYSKPILTDVTATSIAGDNSVAVYNLDHSSATMINVTADAFGGTDNNIGVLNNAFSMAVVRNSSISGGSSLSNIYSSTADVANTQLAGAAGGGGFRCVGAYDNSFAVLGHNCL